MIIAFNWRTFWVKSLSQEVLSPYLTISVFLFPFFLIFSWIILYYFVFSPLLIHLSHLTDSFSILSTLPWAPGRSALWMTSKSFLAFWFPVGFVQWKTPVRDWKVGRIWSWDIYSLFPLSGGMVPLLQCNLLHV